MGALPGVALAASWGVFGLRTIPANYYTIAFWPKLDPEAGQFQLDRVASGRKSAASTGRRDGTSSA